MLLAITIIFGSTYVGLGEVDFSGIFAINAEAASESDLTFVISDDYTTFSVTDCNMSASGSLTIPSTHNGKPVTSIGGLAFADCTSLTSITIPDSVTSIGGDAFARCSKLALISIPDSVTSIGEYAFLSCTSLKSIVIPDSVKSLGKLAFSGCRAITSIELSNSLSSIEYATFNCCENLASITIPDSVTSIGGNAFANCTSLTSITIPDSVTSIGEAPFQGCTNLTEVKISANNTACAIVDGVLFNKDQTELIEFLASNTNTTYAVPDSVTSIGEDAFNGCIGLTSITIPDGVTSIGDWAFYNCSNLKYVFYTGTETDWSKITNDSNNTALISAAIHYEATGHIYDDWITDVEPSCTVVGQKSRTCNVCNYKQTEATATSHYYADGNCSICGIAQEFTYTVENNTVKITGYTGTGTDVVIPSFIDGLPVTSIGESAFEGNTTITTINVPGTLKRTENRAFYNCNKLNAVYITDLVAWCAIEHYANDSNPLYYARNLYINGELATDIVIPEGVTKINDYAFYWGTSIKSVTIPKTVTAIGYSAFHNCKLSNLYIDNLEAWCNVNFSGDAANPMYYTENTYIDGKLATKIVIPDTVTKLKRCSFYGCKTLVSVTIPSSVTSIEYAAFYNCTRLSSITIDDSVTNIEGYAFNGTAYYNNTNNWDNNVLYIDNHLIKAKTTLLGYYEVKPDTKTIAYQAFYGCKELTTIVLPDGVTGIGEWAFYNCTSLISIAIPESIKTIGYYAFQNCNSLVYVFYSGLETDWAEISIGANNQLKSAAIHYNSTDHTYKEEHIAPTCTEDGGKGKKCVVCGCALDYETIPATGHQTTEWITEKEPTCDVAGYKDEWCLDCGEIINTEEIPATGHLNTEWITEKEPTCDEAGYKDEWCLDCGELINSEEIPATGHSYNEWSIDVEPSCKEEGSKHHTCSVCGDVETEVISSNGHNYSEEWTIDIEPTCSEEGSKSHHCSVCGDKADVTVVEPLGHIYSEEWTIDVAPTCTEEGSKSHHCTGCDEEIADVTVIEPLGHNFESISIADEHPHTNAFKCSRCPETKEEESYSEKCGICNFSYTDNGDDTCKITGYIGSSVSMFIPASIDG